MNNKKYKDFRKQRVVPNRLKGKFPRKCKLLKELEHVSMGIPKKITILKNYNNEKYPN